jgi:hypothetical protein
MTLRLVLPCLVLAALANQASGGDPPPPVWNRPKVRQEAARVLSLLRPLLRATERGDGRPALKALDDKSWIVRRAAAIRLKALGLNETHANALRIAAKPGSSPTPRAHASRRAAEAIAMREIDAMPVPEVSAGEAARIVFSIVTLYVREGREKQPARRELLATLLAYRPSLPKATDRGFLAQVVLEVLDRGDVLAELNLKKVKGIKKAGGRALFRWFSDNADYLYWHPVSRTFSVDRQARTARLPTDRYRAKTPWPKGQGPKEPRRRPPR